MNRWVDYRWIDRKKEYQQPQICRWYYPNGRKQRGTKEPLNEGGRGEWRKTGLKLNIKKSKITASGPITSWQISAGKMKTMPNFIFLGSKITEDGDSSHAIERHLLLGRKVMTNLDSVLKSRDITLPTKVCIVEDIVFPVVMCRCESWTVKKSEHRRIDILKLF